MIKTIKIVLITLLLCFSIIGIALAEDQTQATSTEAIADENIQATDLGVSNPTVLPDSPLYFLKDLGRAIQNLITIDPVKKAELKEKVANEKIIEAQKLVEKGANPETVQKAIDSYQQYIEQITAIAQQIKSNASTSTSTAKFLDKYIQQQTLHEQILQKLETKVPTSTLEKIQATRENHLENFLQVMTKLENKDKIQQTIENSVGKIQGSDFKPIQNLEVLKKLEEKAPEDIKAILQQAQQQITEKLQQKLSSSTPEQQEKLNNYIQKIGGDKEKKVQILQNLKNTIKNATATAKSLELKDRLQKIENKLAPVKIEAECNNLWWFDKNNNICQQKKFCGAYMYLGLHTFNTLEECQAALKKVLPPASTTAQ